MKPLRPKRLVLKDFAGRPLTLDDADTAWTCLQRAGQDLLVLGLGTGTPPNLPLFSSVQRIYWLEAEQTLHALQTALESALPALPDNWVQVTAEQAIRLFAKCTVYFYRAGLRLAPDFWGTLLGKMEAATSSCKVGDKQHTTVYLPGNETLLLHRELRQALQETGFSRIVENEHLSVADLKQDCAHDLPDFLLSVNLRGLDADGRVFYFLRALGVPVAIWFVDTPWHILSQLRLPWWTEAALFVTDESFCSGLKRMGAKFVWPLPLAVASGMWRPVPEKGEELATPLFVGHSAFAEREQFFAAATVPASLRRQAEQLLNRNFAPAQCPHIHWWQRQMQVAPWPGQGIRNAGLGADQCALSKRVQWLKEITRQTPLRIVGDAGWQNVLAQPVLPPVDYYGELAELYRKAVAVLSVTSLLLPYSLNQRHFDVWAAGGYLLTDASPGLELFPPYLFKSIVLRRPEDFVFKVQSLREHPERALSLRLAWREYLRAEHTYVHRVKTISALLQKYGCC